MFEMSYPYVMPRATAANATMVTSRGACRRSVRNAT